jgi:hypothetical protein
MFENEFVTVPNCSFLASSEEMDFEFLVLFQQDILNHLNLINNFYSELPCKFF